MTCSQHKVQVSLEEAEVTRWEGDSNEIMYERYGMGACASGVKSGVVEWVQGNILRRFGHTKRTNSEKCGVVEWVK